MAFWVWVFLSVSESVFVWVRMSASKRALFVLARSFGYFGVLVRGACEISLAAVCVHVFLFVAVSIYGDVRVSSNWGAVCVCVNV